jgi:DNA-binding response OmpR family regulator
MPKVLIADDEPYIRLLMEQTLEDIEDEGVEILFAENGEVALSIIKEQKPDIVFLDIMMPKMNGFEVCREVKKNLKIPNIYIVILTAKGQEIDKLKAYEAGADIYMAKPFNPDDIINKVREIITI